MKKFQRASSFNESSNKTLPSFESYYDLTQITEELTINETTADTTFVEDWRILNETTNEEFIHERIFAHFCVSTFV